MARPPGLSARLKLTLSYAGFLLVAGALLLAVVWLFLLRYVRRGDVWAWVGAVVAPVVGLAVALPAHYPNSFDALRHLGLIYLATAIYVIGALIALRGMSESRRA